MKNNLKFYLMSALCSIALINTSGHSMHNHQNAFYSTQPNKGLENIGATCYMNATLQCFASCQELVDYFYTPTCNNKIMSFHNSNDSGKRNVYDFIKLMQDMNNPNSSSKQYIVPKYFKNSLSVFNPLFKGIQANDSKDLVLCILENSHNQLNNPIVNQNQQQLNQYDYQSTKQHFLNYFHSQYRSKISELFYGIYNSMMKCENCNAIAHNVQCYNMLIFPLEEVRKYKNPQGNSVTLEDCFQYYEKGEHMTGENMIWCNNCHTYANSCNQSRLVTSPEYLIINLNRGKGLQFDVKFQTSEVVDLGKYVFDQPNNSKYRLMGVIVHYGPSSMGGHFIAYTKKDGQVHWFCYNDAQVTEVKDISSILNGNQTSYVLFYKKIDNNTYNQLKQQEINIQQQAPKNNSFNNNNVQLNNTTQLNIFMSPEQLRTYYSKNCNPQLHTKYNINTDVNKYFELFNYDPMDLQTCADMKRELNLLLQKTMQFLTNYSIQGNREVCKKFETIWQKYSDALYEKSHDISNHEHENYFNLKLSFDLICASFLPDYNIKVNTKGNNITMDNLQKQFGELNINNNINHNKQTLTVDERFDRTMRQIGLAGLDKNTLKIIVQMEREKIPSKDIPLNQEKFEEFYSSIWSMSNNALQARILNGIEEEEQLYKIIENVLRDTISFYHHHSPKANPLFCTYIYNAWKNIWDYLDQGRGKIYANNYSQPVKIIMDSLHVLNNIDGNNENNIDNNMGMHKPNEINNNLNNVRLNTVPNQIQNIKNNINIGNIQVPDDLKDITIDTDNHSIAECFRKNGLQSREGNVISERDLNSILDQLKAIVPSKLNSNLGINYIKNMCTRLLQQTILITKSYKNDQKNASNVLVYQTLIALWKDVLKYVYKNQNKTLAWKLLLNRLVRLDQLLAQLGVKFIAE